MRNLGLSLLVVFSIGLNSAEAVKLSDYSPYEFDVRFTNPTCPTYYYKETVKDRKGNVLDAKPKNVYCKKSYDKKTKSDTLASWTSKRTPAAKFKKWVRSRYTREIFLTYLSFSNDNQIKNKEGEVVKRYGVYTELCRAIKKGKKVTLLLHKSNKKRARLGYELKSCMKKGAKNYKFIMRGNVSGIDFAHNKLLFINPSSKRNVKIAFSSGNLSTGIDINHENWNFVTTHPKSYFAQVHGCLMRGVIKHAESGKQYRKYIRDCRAEIKAEEEEDIKVFFVPGEGKQATAAIVDTLENSDRVWMAAHRFSYRTMLEALSERLAVKDGVDIRLIADDDIYWSGRYRKDYTPNNQREYWNVRRLEKKGMRTKYMQTANGQRQLHHNKFIVFDDYAVFTGAGNFTGTAFRVNLENFYFITIPSVVKKYKRQFVKMWEDMATFPKEMPKNLTHEVETR